MDMQSPNRGPAFDNRSLGELFKALAAEAEDLLRAEVRLAELRFNKRLRMAAVPAVFFAVAAALGLIAVMAIAFAIGVLVAPLIGFVAAAILVAVLAGIAAFLCLRAGQARMQAVASGLETAVDQTKAEIVRTRDQLTAGAAT